MITVLQEQLFLTITQKPIALTIEDVLNPVTVKQELPEQITVQQVLNPIIVQGGNLVANIIPFSFQATSNGQTSFGPLPNTPVSVICCFVMGTAQDQIAGDFISSGLNIVLGSTAPVIVAGDYVFGAIQI